MAGTPRIGIAGMHEDLEALVHSNGERVPAYRQLMRLVQEALPGPLGARLAEVWAERSFHIFYDRPLLFLAALRFDALKEGTSHPLWDAVGGESKPEAVTVAALDAATTTNRSRFWDALRTRGVQTNETSRAVAWMWPAALVADEHRPLALVDLGTSAGLNLVADRLPPIWTMADGSAAPVVREVPTVLRLGLDRRPLDLGEADNEVWLRACIWPGEHDRLARLEQAIAALRSVRGTPGAPLLEARSAVDFPLRLRELNETLPEETLVLAFQTVMREYLPPEERAVYLSGMTDWLLSRPPRRALWIELEAPPDGATPALPAAIIAHATGDDGAPTTRVLARCGFHPRVLHPTGEVPWSIGSGPRS